jgi:hypothetical protein
MKLLKSLVVGMFSVALLATPLYAAEQTCCEKAHAESKECAHKCCVDAHKEGKSCTKCNPNKEDEKFIKKDEKKDAPK